MKNPYANISTPIWLLAVISLINRSGNMVVIFLPLYLTQKLGFDITITGAVLSLFGLGMILGSYMGGILTDRFGFLWVQVSSLFFAGMLYFLLEFWHSVVAISSSMFLIGFIASWLRPATAATIAKFTTKKVRSLAYALNYQATNIGSTIGPALGGILASANYVWLFRVEGMMNIFAALVMWLSFRNRNDEMVVDDQSDKLSPDIAWWKNSSLRTFLFLTFSIGLVFLLFLNIYPLYLREVYLLTPFRIGLVMAVNGLVIILFQIHFAQFLNKFNILRVIGVGGFFICLGYFILPFYNGFYYAIFSMIVMTFGEMAVLPFMNNFVIMIAPRKAQGKYLGLVQSSFSFPLLLTPSLGAYVYTQYGPNTLWYFTGVVGVIVFIGFERLKVNYSYLDLKASQKS
jgi:predicted MFS family arabinose efflux permease